MKLTEEERKQLTKNVREAYIEEVERRVLERILNDQTERINQYAAAASGELAEEFRKLFPL